MSTPPDEMKRRAQARLSAVPPSGNAPVGPATVQPRWTPSPSPIWTPPGAGAAPVQQPSLPSAAAVSDRLAAARAPRPGMPTPTMVRERLAGAPAQQPLPSYRTPNGFQQTAAPVNPNPRPAAVPPAPSGAAARVPGATGRPLRPAGKISPGSAAALALEGLNIAGAAQQGGMRGAITETAAAGTRLGAAKLGAELGGSLPLPGAWKGAGVALGGLAGYAGGQQLVEYATQHTPDWVKEGLNYLGDAPTDAASAASVAGKLGRSVGERFVQGPNSNAVARLASMPATPNPTIGMHGQNGLQPASPQDPSAGKRVIGTYQADGRSQRQVFEDGSVSPAQAGANGAFSVIPAYQGTTSPAAQRLAAPTISSAGFADSERRQFNEQIDQQIKSLGDLNMASKRRLVADLLGLKGQSVGRGFDAANGRNTAQAELAQRTGEAQLRADVDREQIAAGERSAKRTARAQTQTITAEDGTVYSIEGSTLTPLATASGEQIKAPRKLTPNPQAEIAAKLLEGMVLPGASPEDIQAAAQQANSAAAALLTTGTGGAQAASAPKSGEVVAGYRFNGGDPNDQKNWTKVE